MKRRLLFISVILAFVLANLMPAAALAAKPGLEEFNATGTISYITPGKVLPAGETGKWVVVKRELGGSLSGSINGAFTMNYHAIIESMFTQAGTLHGTLEVGSYVLKVDGTIQPLEWLGEPFASPALLTMSGQWRFTNSTWGRGDFSASVLFIPTPEGHVGSIIDSAFTMTGKWNG